MVKSYCRGFRQVMIRVERPGCRKWGFKEEDLFRADSALICSDVVTLEGRGWGNDRGCLAHAPGICCQAAGCGCGLGRAGQAEKMM